jgi:hypothetical protein
MRSRNVSSPDMADACVLALMKGWGSLPANLNPAGNKRMHQELATCARLLPRHSSGRTTRVKHGQSLFATPYIDFSRGWEQLWMPVAVPAQSILARLILWQYEGDGLKVKFV